MRRIIQIMIIQLLPGHYLQALHTIRIMDLSVLKDTDHPDHQDLLDHLDYLNSIGYLDHLDPICVSGSHNMLCRSCAVQIQPRRETRAKSFTS